MEPLLQLEGVTKVFTTDEVETHALAGIHLEINRGDYVSISGPSGCGKSTLLAILGLLDTPSDGKYVLNQTPVELLKMRDRARIRNRVPQRVTARVVAVTGDQVRILTLPIGPDGRGRLALTDEVASADRSAVIVAGLTPLTKESMPFTLALERS